MIRTPLILMAVTLLGCPVAEPVSVPPASPDAGMPKQAAVGTASGQVRVLMKATSQALSARQFSPTASQVGDSPRAALSNLRRVPFPDVIDADIVPGQLVLNVDQPSLVDDLISLARVQGTDCVIEKRILETFVLLQCRTSGELIDAAAIRQLVQLLGTAHGVQFIEPNIRAHKMAVPNDVHYSYQWHYQAIRLPEAWDITQGAPSTVVAVIDTGIVPHPDIEANLLPGADFITDVDEAGDGDGWDADPTDLEEEGANGGYTLHGLHCAGTIAAVSDNGAFGAGAAGRARVVPIRVLGINGAGTNFDIIAGMYWAAGLRVSDFGVNRNPAAVISMSLGGKNSPLASYQKAIDAIVAAGAVVVVAAGNDDEDAATACPCNQNNVICVGATTRRGQRADYSNFGREVTVMAPGGATGEDVDGDGAGDGVWSLGRQGRAWILKGLQGTSMATPHVAGVVALLKTVKPSLTAMEVRQVLTSTANPSGRCTEGCGAGLIDAKAALDALEDHKQRPGKLTVSASSLLLTRDAPEQMVTLMNVGDEPIEWKPTSASKYVSRIDLHISAQERTLAPGASVTFGLSFDTSGLTTLGFDVDVNFESDSDVETVMLRIRAPVRPKGETIVALVCRDEEGDWRVAGNTRADANKAYSFQVSAPPGEYYLVSAADSNGDGQFTNDEPIGIWPNSSEPELVKIVKGQNIPNLSFALSALYLE